MNLLADLSADVIKLDMALTRNLHERRTARIIVKHLVRMAAEMGSDLIAEGIETMEEYEALRECGVKLMQGYLLARPGVETLPTFTVPGARVREELLDASTKLFRVA